METDFYNICFDTTLTICHIKVKALKQTSDPIKLYCVLQILANLAEKRYLPNCKS